MVVVKLGIVTIIVVVMLKKKTCIEVMERSWY